MEVSIDQTKWYDRILASFIFFTRLPFWRLHQPPVACYQTVVEHWPLTGWLTGGAMGLTLYFATLIFPGYIGVLLAILVRILITGALHEDGLADFIDGFGGGGSDRQRILNIMKDSHIGTYGVLGLILYFLILTAAIYSIPPYFAALLVFAADQGEDNLVHGAQTGKIPFRPGSHDVAARPFSLPLRLSSSDGKLFLPN